MFKYIALVFISITIPQQTIAANNIYEMATNSAVYIYARTLHGFEEDDEAEGASSGSGFLLDKDKGLIMTNAHVAGHGHSELKLRFHNQRHLQPAEKIFVDPYHDVAVIKVNPTSIPQTAEELSLDCDYEPTRGEEIIAIGHPKSSEFQVTRGIISGVYDDNVDGVYWSTDLVIEEGSSGGAAISLSTGKVIGIPTYTLKESDISLLTKASAACMIWKPLHQGISPKRPILGFQQMLVDGFLSKKVGLVSDPTSPLRPGDLILSWGNDYPWDIEKNIRFADVLRGIDKRSITLKIQRGNTIKEVSIPLKEGIAQNERKWVYFTGLTFAETTHEDSNRIVDYYPNPVIRLQTKRINESELDGFEVRPMAILHSVNGVKITSIEQLAKLIHQAEIDKENVELIFNAADITPESWRYMFSRNIQVIDFESNITQ